MAHCFRFSSTVLRAPLTRGYLEGFLLHYYKQDNYFFLKDQRGDIGLSLLREREHSLSQLYPLIRHK